jgi:uncharacterized protein YndB with AHSA1/START domain
MTGARRAGDRPAPPGQFDGSILISAAPTRVMAAFFDAEALSVWWRTIRSVTTPRPLGVYAVEWAPDPEPDAILGRLGGVFHGTVAEFTAGRELFVADAWWLPPDGDPVGPMALEVSCWMDGPACRLRVRQSGFEEGPRWRRYYEVIGPGWSAAMRRLKDYIERP